MTLPRDLGDSVTLRFEVRNAAGSLVDATVTCTVTKPDGTTDTTAPVNSSTGVYTRTLVLDQAGVWIYRWVATGAATTAEDGQLIVEALLGPTLYCTVEEVREHLGDAGVLVAGQLEAAVRAASRAVDAFCRRRFWLDPTATTRAYTACHRYELQVEDIGSATGLQVATDSDGDGVFETTWTSGDRQLEPVNAPAWGGAYAYTRLRAVGAQTFPVGSLTGRPGVQVTARHGWSQVPDPVREATLLKAVALWRRKDAPFGVAGFGSFGALRITRTDPDVVELLGPYRRYVVA